MTPTDIEQEDYEQMFEEALARQAFGGYRAEGGDVVLEIYPPWNTDTGIATENSRTAKRKLYEIDDLDLKRPPSSDHFMNSATYRALTEEW